MDGVSSVAFPAGLGNTSYLIAVRHRNHLGVRTEAAVLLTATTPALNFMAPAGMILHGTDPENLDPDRNLRMLWAGNANLLIHPTYLKQTIVAGGQANDLGTIRTKIGQNPVNADQSTNIKFEGYFVEDVNLDGHVVGAGTGNDISTLRANVGANPINTTQSVSIVKEEQLP